MTIQLAYQQLLSQLYSIYDEREAANIADLVIEHVTGQPKIERITNKFLPITDQQQQKLNELTPQLLQHRPVQYVLQEAWFMQMKMFVNEHVLIPRPETEELVQWIINDIRGSGNSEVSLLDIGTGSGIIPIAVRKQIPEVAVSGIDISEDALQVARFNSIEQKTLVDFLNVDFLAEEEWNHLGRYNVIASNPPYIKVSEGSFMSKNVLYHEPRIALFVPDEDPLVFYRHIAMFGNLHLKEGGAIYMEINEALGNDVVQLFLGYEYRNVQLKQDMQGKDRMVKAQF